MTEYREPSPLGLPGAVEPLYFGPSRLFGCVQGGRAASAVVICYPFGHEYVTLHRALRQLATQVSRRGPGVVRFDYSGTGDSPGRLADASLEAWCDEIEEAIALARRTSGAESICLVGVRLGGALALRCARRRDDVVALALWDPVVWGKAYLRELARSDRRMRRVAHVVADPAGRSSEARDVLGFPLGDAMKQEIKGIELDRESPPDTEKVLLLESRQASTAPLGASLRAAGLDVESACEPHPGLWRWQEDITKVELPHRSVRRLASWIVEAVS